MCILIWNILLRNWLCTGIKTNWNANEYGRMKRTHGTSSYRTDRIQRSHTFIGVMPIVASCWQNEFPRNLFALKTCDNEKQKENMNEWKRARHARVRALTQDPCAHRKHSFSSPNFWFIINDRYHAILLSIGIHTRGKTPWKNYEIAAMSNWSHSPHGSCKLPTLLIGIRYCFA